MLKVYEGVFLQTLVERPQIRRAEAERIIAGKVVKVPVDELPIESVVVGNEHHAPLAVRRKPFLKVVHYIYILCVTEGQAFFSGESADCERVRDELIGN